MVTSHTGVSYSDDSEAESYDDTQSANESGEHYPEIEIDLLSPNIKLYTIQCLVDELPVLDDRNLIFSFTRQLELDISKIWELTLLIERPAYCLEDTQKQFSCEIASLIRPKIKLDTGSNKLPVTYYELMKYLKSLVTDFHPTDMNYTDPLVMTRSPRQSFDDYVKTFQSVCLRITGLRSIHERSPQVVRLAATMLWRNHFEHYNYDTLDTWFENELPTWKCLHDVFEAFRSKRRLNLASHAETTIKHQKKHNGVRQKQYKYKAVSKTGGGSSTEAVSLDHVRLAFSLAAQNNWKIDHTHINGAYKNDSRSEENSDSEDLEENPHRWFHKFASLLKSMGLNHASEASGVFFKRTKVLLLVLVYVDDIIIMSSNSNKSDIGNFKKRLRRQFELEDSSHLESYLSIHIEETKSGYTLDARKNISKLLKMFKNEIKSSSFGTVSPIADEEERLAHFIELKQKNGGALSGIEKVLAQPISKPRQSKFRSAIGMLTYLVSSCRPDIAFATSNLARYASKQPNKLHWLMLLRLLVYLKQNPDGRLVCEKQNHPELIGYADALQGGGQMPHTHGGFIWKYGNCPIHWASRKTVPASKSSLEAKLRCRKEALEYGVKLKKFLHEIGEMPQNRTCVLHTTFEFDQLVPGSLEQLNSEVKCMDLEEELEDICYKNNIELSLSNCPPVEAADLTQPVHFGKEFRSMLVTLFK